MLSNLTIAPNVANALENNLPIVALESTVITHGLPYPDNLTTAQRMEAAVCAAGAVPATIAILDGTIHVGLDDDQLERLAQLDGSTVRKCSRRDLPIVVARGEHGATTVAGTMVIAHMAGIELFATGGIGGVHRGHPFDISADLTELGRTAVTVVCSGVKSILDLPATREVLETNGVTVVGYQTDCLPAFYSRESELLVDVRVEEAQEAAAIVMARRGLGLQMGTVVGVPVPKSAELPPNIAESATQQAQAEADAQGIHGAAATPFLLQRMVELTDGASMHANIALLENNAKVAAQIAVACKQ